MTAAVIGSGSGAWYAVALLVVFTVLAIGGLCLNGMLAVLDRWRDNQSIAAEDARRLLLREVKR